MIQLVCATSLSLRAHPTYQGIIEPNWAIVLRCFAERGFGKQRA